MARKTKRTTDQQAAGRRYREAAYTEGNTVRIERLYENPRREYEVPKRRRELTREENREEQRKKIRIRKNQDKALQMNPGFVFFLTLAAVGVLFICVNYMKVQMDINSAMRGIKAAELELEELKADNDLLESRLEIQMDLDYIYNVATGELGMTRPREDQILYYQKTESEYVRQYESIP